MKAVMMILTLMTLACGKSNQMGMAPSILPSSGVYNLATGQCSSQTIGLGDLQEQLSVQGNQVQIQDMSVSAGCMITTSGLVLSQEGDNVTMTGGTVSATQLNCTPSKTNNCVATACNIAITVNGVQETLGIPNFPIFLDGKVSYSTIGSSLVRYVNNTSDGDCTFTYKN
jgi:hypothetical protein